MELLGEDHRTRHCYETGITGIVLPRSFPTKISGSVFCFDPVHANHNMAFKTGDFNKADLT